MSSKHSAPSQKEFEKDSRQAVIIPFHLLSKNRQPSCIFCGQTLSIHRFKGKAVCLNCLQQIPAIFSCG